MIAAPHDWASALRKAEEHIRGLQNRTAHQATRDSCHWLLAAFASLETLPDKHSPALLTTELRRDQAGICNPVTPPRERCILRLRQHLLRHRMLGLASEDGCVIPRVVHLIRTDARIDDLPLLQYLCYGSVLVHCKGYRIILHAPFVPRGARWQKLLPHLELNVAPPPQFLGGNRLIGAAHQSDVWRLQQLIEHGGLYFDWDLLLLRSPERLQRDVCVMALEKKEPGYHEVLGVSVIGAEPDSQFLATWLDAMPGAFDPRLYVGHSTLLAQRLALRLPSLVRLLDYRSFYFPGWGEQAMRWLFDPAERVPEEELHAMLAASTGVHLFCSHANFVHWARHLTERDIETPSCNLASLMRPYL